MSVMQTQSTIRKAKAISPIIATIILIVLTVVAGGFIYAYAMGMLRSGSTAQSVEVQSDNLVVPSGSGTATWSLTLQNTGSVAVKNANATLEVSISAAVPSSGSGNIGYTTYYVSGTAPSGYGPNNPIIPPGKISTSSSGTLTVYPALEFGAISPGTTQSVSITMPNSGIIAGDTYTIQITIEYANGATQTITSSVTATSF